MEANYEKEIRNLPSDIADKEVELVSLQKKINEMVFIREIRDIEIYNDITKELAEDGKKKYTNESQRKEELRKRTYNKNDEIEDLKDKVKALEINLGFLKRTFRMHELFARVGL